MDSQPVFRARIYSVDPVRLPAFTEFFLTHLLPIQESHGAKLVGRWSSADESKVIAVWMYNSAGHAELVQDAVRNDPRSESARLVREESEPFYISYEEMMLTSTVDLDRTLLATSR
jgi:hypothetical protein